jgi:hypothetical protein
MNQDFQSHRASPELWAAAEKFGQNSMDMLNCLLELRSRIEALEAAQRESPMAELRAASAEARPAGGLVERVAAAMRRVPNCDDETWETEARAAIREVAAAVLQMDPDKNLTQKGIHELSSWERVALWLEQEASRG